MTPSPLIEAEGLHKSIAHRPILRELSFSLVPGGFNLLLGHNGAGKSTLLQLLSGLMHPSGGVLRFRGKLLPGALPALRAVLGVISHESRLYGDLTARENLRLFGTLYGVVPLAPQIEAALERVNLAEVPDVPVRTFSSGMTKRVAIARLLLYTPTLLLLDEPYSGLDQASATLFDTYLSEFKANGGTVVLATHQFTHSLALCDRIFILQGGRLVYNQPEAGPSAERCAELLARHDAEGSGGVDCRSSEGLDGGAAKNSSIRGAPRTGGGARTGGASPGQ